MVYGICRLMLRDADEAEDAAQQVFLSAYRSLLAGTEPRNAGAWLGTIARNEARGRIAARTLRPVGLDGQRERTSATLEEQAVARAELAELRDELSALPEKQREAVVLRDLYGLRYDEVARALNTSRPAVEALLFRGRRQIQRRLRPGLAAGVLVVPLALRESLAYAVPGFAAGGASTAGLLTKLAAVPIAAKLAAAGATVGVAGSAGLVAERELHTPLGWPSSALVEPAPAVQQHAGVVLQPIAESRSTGQQDTVGEDDRDEDGDRGREGREVEDDESHGRDDDDGDEPEQIEDVEEPDSSGKSGSRSGHIEDDEADSSGRSVSRAAGDDESERADEPDKLDEADQPDDADDADEAAEDE